MKQLFLAILFFGLSFLGFTQDDEEKKLNFSYSIRGKALAGPSSPEDDFAMTATIGNELSLNRHSIGADFTFFRFRHQYDNSGDAPVYDNFERRRYLLFDYKFDVARFYWGDIYLNAYHKIGLYDNWNEVITDSLLVGNMVHFTQSTSQGTFNEPGFGVGAKFYWGNFGIDASANFGHRFNVLDHVNVLSDTETEHLNGVETDRNIFYIRLNLFYEFGR